MNNYSKRTLIEKTHELRFTYIRINQSSLYIYLNSLDFAIDSTHKCAYTNRIYYWIQSQHWLKYLLKRNKLFRVKIYISNKRVNYVAKTNTAGSVHSHVTSQFNKQTMISCNLFLTQKYLPNCHIKAKTYHTQFVGI